MRRISPAALLLLAVLGSSCARRGQVSEVADVGRHRVRFTTPLGWEHLDHGRAQLFRNGEVELRLEDIDLPRSPTPTSSDQLVGYVLGQSHDGASREIVRRDSLDVHDTPWIRLETWSRLSHMSARRTAFTVRDSSLLTLVCERGTIDRTGAAFDSLLMSLEVLEQR